MPDSDATVGLGYTATIVADARRARDTQRKRLRRASPVYRIREYRARNCSNQTKVAKARAKADDQPWISDPNWRCPPGPVDHGPFEWDRTIDGKLDELAPAEWP